MAVTSSVSRRGLKEPLGRPLGRATDCPEVERGFHASPLRQGLGLLFQPDDLHSDLDALAFSVADWQRRTPVLHDAVVLVENPLAGVAKNFPRPIGIAPIVI